MPDSTIEKRVLVVEDDDSMATFINHVLTRASLQMTHVTTAELALVRLEHETWDGLLADIRLPGMSGLDLTRQLRAQGSRLPVAVMTAHHAVGMAAEVNQAGADLFLTKPFSASELVRSVEHLCDSPAGGTVGTAAEGTVGTAASGTAASGRSAEGTVGTAPVTATVDAAATVRATATGPLKEKTKKHTNAGKGKKVGSTDLAVGPIKATKDKKPKKASKATSAMRAGAPKPAASVPAIEAPKKAKRKSGKQSKKRAEVHPVTAAGALAVAAAQPRPLPVRDDGRNLIAVVPAHNEDDIIAETLDSLLAQTRLPDRIVVMADNCQDGTVEIVESYVKRFPELIEVRETEDNQHRKVGALTQAWQRYQEGSDLWLGVDADTRLDPHCVEQLEAELLTDQTIAGIMARYTFRQEEANDSFFSRQLVRMQRFEFASWLRDLLHRDRETYVLGGQCTLFRTDALRSVEALDNRPGPWTPESEVEDMELTWRLKALGYQTLVSATARAYAGAMSTFRSLWAQRRKWDHGIVRLLRKEGFTSYTRYVWFLQAKMALDMAIRGLFVVLLCAALILHAFIWFWIWAIPPILAMLLNLQVAMVVPRRRASDVFAGVTLLSVELYLWFRLAVWCTSWVSDLLGNRADRWAMQYSAEGKAPAQLQVGVVAS